jgi:hypothetical protein
LEPINKKSYAIVLALLSCVCVFVYVFYSHKYNLAYTILPLVFLFAIWIFAVNTWMPESWMDKLPLTIRGLIYALLFGIVFSGLSGLRQIYEHDQLRKYGVVVSGRVVSSESNGAHGFFVEIEYYYGKTTYRQRLADSVYAYKYHDELKVLCSSREPEIFSIAGHKPALDIKY